jgi:predicted transcriptional regulator
MREFAKIIGREESVAKDRMRVLMIKGLAERKYFRSRVPTGGIQRIPFYRLVKRSTA